MENSPPATSHDMVSILPRLSRLSPSLCPLLRLPTCPITTDGQDPTVGVTSGSPVGQVYPQPLVRRGPL